MKMSIVIDKCFLLDNNTTDSLSLKSGYDIMCFTLSSPNPIIHNLSCDVLYKFWLKNVTDDTFSILKIEELIEEEDDYPEPDENETNEIRNSLLSKIEEAIVLKRKTLSQLENIQKQLSEKKVSLKSMEEAYNELNECI
jgi:hypothetical protein